MTTMRRLVVASRQAPTPLRIVSHGRAAALMSTQKTRETVAVTGASGYLGSYICEALLNRGHRVRAPIRNATPQKVAHLKELPGAAEGLEILDGGDLEIPGSFDDAFRGATAVVHSAAVVELNDARDASRVIQASTRGAATVVDAAIKANVPKFVLTSSIAAVQCYDYGDSASGQRTQFDERDWNEASMDSGDFYGFAKAAAEKYTRDALPRSIALHPGVVLGPVMTKAHAKASPIFLRDLIYGNALLRMPATTVDVRDVADAHANAVERFDELVTAEAHHARFVLVNDAPCAADLPGALFDVASRAVPEIRLPPLRRKPRLLHELLVPVSRFVHGVFPASLAANLAPLSPYHLALFTTPIDFDNSRAKTELGVTFRPLQDTVRDGVRAILEKGFAKVPSSSKQV